MINFLTIFVSTQSDQIFKETWAQKIYDFLNNLLTSGVFDIEQDCLILYLEDLYLREDCNTSQFIKDAIKSRIQHGAYANLNYKIYVNKTEKFIIKYFSDVIGREVDDIAHHLKTFYKICRIAIAPTLLKEFIQQFFLYFQTNKTNNISVYHDLDMRYRPDTSPSSLFQTRRNFYLQQTTSVLAPFIHKLKEGFDVFWAISLPSQEDVFINSFLNTLYTTICCTYWKCEINPTQIAALKADLAFWGTKQFKDYLTFFNVDTIDENINQENELKAIISLHCGLDAEQIPDTHPQRQLYPRKDVLPSRVWCLTLFFMHAYLQPFREYFLSKNSTPILLKQKQQILEDMRSFIFEDQNGFKLYTPQFGFKLKAIHRDFDEYVLEELGLFKHCRGTWKNVPSLPNGEINSICKTYPFMKFVLDVTKPMRALVQQGRITVLSELIKLTPHYISTTTDFSAHTKNFICPSCHAQFKSLSSPKISCEKCHNILCKLCFIECERCTSSFCNKCIHTHECQSS